MTATAIPNIPFTRIAERIGAYWNPYKWNPHQSLLGISRCGKSYLIRNGILPIAGAGRIVVIDVKPGGSRTWKDYGNAVSELSPGFGTGPDGTAHYHFLARSRDQVKRFLEMIALEGSCIIVLDDSRRVTANAPDWGLGSIVDALLTIGAEIGISVLICANSTVWATSALRDQTGISWIGQMANQDERAKFLRIAGLPKDLLPVLGKLKPREFLYSDRFDGDIRLALTRFGEPAESTRLRIVR
jgi:hypothetical protein